MILASAVLFFSTGCSTVSETVREVFVEGDFPEMPTPEIATYVVDLSGSTYPIQQLTALGSGIEDFLSGDSFGDPFSNPRIAPKSLSIQFITANSANAPRIPLVSAESGIDLYDWLKVESPNLDQARPLWRKFVKARTDLFKNTTSNLDSCVSSALTIFGQQGLSSLVLREPAQVICEDVRRSQSSLSQLREFVASPGVPLGSDVFGALELATANLKRAEIQFPFSRKSVVFASDMIDATPSRGFNQSLRGIADPEAACEMAKSDLAQTYGSSFPFQDLTVVLVGQGNSRADIDLISKVRRYWSCYFTAAGAELIETSDLNNY
jgi:hypothetical protein